MNMEKEITEYLVSKYEPEAIILHGSRARGANREDSDWDTYVFVNEKEKKSATEQFEGQQLDIAVIYLPIEEYDFVDEVGPTLRRAKILYDKDGIAARIMNEIQRVYGEGKKLSEQDILNRRNRFQRMLSRIKGTIDNDELFFYHAGSFYPSVIRYWFELKERWPEPPYDGLPIIEKEDPEFYKLLKVIAGSTENKKRAEAFEEIYKKLFTE